MSAVLQTSQTAAALRGSASTRRAVTECIGLDAVGSTAAPVAVGREASARQSIHWPAFTQRAMRRRADVDQAQQQLEQLFPVLSSCVGRALPGNGARIPARRRVRRDGAGLRFGAVAGKHRLSAAAPGCWRHGSGQRCGVRYVRRVSAGMASENWSVIVRSDEIATTTTDGGCHHGPLWAAARHQKQKQINNGNLREMSASCAPSQQTCLARALQ